MKITRTRAPKDWAISLILIILGVALMIFGSTGILILGAIVAVLGLVLLLILKSYCRFEGNPANYVRNTVELSSSQKSNVQDFIAGKNVQIVKGGSAAGGLLLYIYTSTNAKANPEAYAHLFEFSQYEYVPLGEPTPITAKQAEELLK